MKKFQVIVDTDLKAIMPRYFEIQQSELSKMELAIGMGDAERLRNFGHKLKGTGASYGFTKLTELGAAIEQAGLGGHIEIAGNLVAEVRAYLENVEIIYGDPDQS